MNKKLIVSLVALVLLIGGSYLLYQRLTKAEPESNITTTQPSQDTTAINNIEDEDFDIEFENEFGEKVWLSSYVGKPIVLNFWASWCPPCREEMPIFADQQRANPDVVFLYVNQTDGTRETKFKAQEFLVNENLPMKIQYDETNQSAIKYGLTSLPSTYFIDAKGDILNRAVGGITADTLIAAITNLTESQ